VGSTDGTCEKSLIFVRLLVALMHNSWAFNRELFSVAQL
jgi:hypothetical protein